MAAVCSQGCARSWVQSTPQQGCHKSEKKGAHQAFLGCQMVFSAGPWQPVAVLCPALQGEQGLQEGARGEARGRGAGGDPGTAPDPVGWLFAPKHRNWGFGTAGQRLCHISGYESLRRQVLLGLWFWGSSGRTDTQRESRNFGRTIWLTQCW